MLRLRHDTPPAWTAVALGDLDAFLQDHARSERKVVSAALDLATHHPDRPELVAAMIDLAEEELGHFRQAWALLSARGQGLGQDRPDPYMSALHKAIRRRDAQEFLLDRLLLFSVVEARGCERFRMLSLALPPGPLRDWYEGLVRCEAKHHGLFLALARSEFGRETADGRLDTLLDLEAEVARALPLRPALH